MTLMDDQHSGTRVVLRYEDIEQTNEMCTFTCKAINCI